MDVKDAVKKAVEYVSDVFESEKLEYVGLEEVVFNEADNEWEITIGFSRPWDFPQKGLITGLQSQSPKRQYKIVRVENKHGQVKSIKIREVSNA